MERLTDDRYRLSSGREFYANHGIIGLAHQDRGTHYPNLGGHGGYTAPWGEPNVGVFELAEGFDGAILDANEWTPEERRELSDYMIELWTRFAVLRVR
jgi:hypothetical protein